MNSIFIQIASYRDPQLIPTIKDILNNAKYPENLTICIAWQHATEDIWDNLDEFKNDSRFKIIDINYQKSKGVCWARNQIQQFYNNEKYTLQIDSHMRFDKNWDETLMSMIENLKEKGYEKPLLTTYAPSFNPQNDPEMRVQVPWRMVFDRFIPEGAIFFLPEPIPEYQTLNEPIPSRFYSAHFCFTLGQFCQEVQHDPEFYFHGEEISIAVRAFTHGYDLFHPHKVVIWHEYTRKDRKKQWDDDDFWNEKNNYSHAKNRKLLGIDEEKELKENKYGLGNKKTLKDYEKYAGILFSKRAVQQYTLEKKYPPNPSIESEEAWLESFSVIFKHCLDLDPKMFPEEDYDFWVVSFHDEEEKEIYRKDADISEINKIKRNGYKIWREFLTHSKPKYWLVWPHSRSKGWCNKIKTSL
jgi:glycosyltransferase involved in cell wall biosynthesis